MREVEKYFPTGALLAGDAVDKDERILAWSRFREFDYKIKLIRMGFNLDGSEHFGARHIQKKPKLCGWLIVTDSRILLMHSPSVDFPNVWDDNLANEVIRTIYFDGKDSKPQLTGWVYRRKRFNWDLFLLKTGSSTSQDYGPKILVSVEDELVIAYIKKIFT